MSSEEDDVFMEDLLNYEVEIPIKEFFFTIEQISFMLQIPEKTLREKYLWYSDRAYGMCPSDQIKATNISTPEEQPVWRVSQTSFIIWMRFKKVTFKGDLRSKYSKGGRR